MVFFQELSQTLLKGFNVVYIFISNTCVGKDSLYFIFTILDQFAIGFSVNMEAFVGKM